MAESLSTDTADQRGRKDPPVLCSRTKKGREQLPIMANVLHGHMGNEWTGVD